jgi:molecular chaperone DnaJ
MRRPPSPLLEPHRILGVRDDATPAEIRTAFRRAAMRHHPDRNPGDAGAAERFRIARAAYEELLRREACSRAPRRRAAPDRPLRIRCLVVGGDLVGTLPEAVQEPGRWVAVELLAASTCVHCGGEGGEDVERSFLMDALHVTHRIECNACDGIGLLRVERRLRIRVPTLPARALRLRGRGVAAAGARGDVILEIG